jgi:hypothetical protein
MLAMKENFVETKGAFKQTPLEAVVLSRGV